MTLARFLLALVLTATVFGSVAVAARALRARLLPAWAGPPAVLVDAVLSVAIVLGVTEILGAAGAFEVVPVALGLIATSGAIWLVLRRLTERTPDPGRATEPLEVPSARPGRATMCIAVGALAVVAATWSAGTVGALHHGMKTVDTLWYHMPAAARFVQTGSITPLHYVDGDALTAFFPAAASQLHGVFILLFDNDFVSPILNLGFLALTLLAAWCIGRPFGVAPLTMIAASAVLATPMLVTTQPGSGYSDTMGVALLLSAVAILVTSGRRFPTPAALGIAALATGLTFAVKYQFLVPCAALTVLVVLFAPRGRRVGTAARWTAVAAIAGGFWYLRNWIEVGNPVPLLDLAVLPRTQVRTPTFALTKFLFDGAVWDDFFLPGLEHALSSAWWALLALVAIGLVWSLVRGRTSMHRAAALMSGATLVGFIVTPAAFGLPGGALIFFEFTLRYTFFGLLLGAIVLALAVNDRLVPWLLSAFAVVLLGTQLDPAVWPTELRDGRFDEPVRNGDAVAGLVIGVGFLFVGLLLVFRREAMTTWRVPAFGVVAVIVAVAGGTYALERLYLRERYRDTEPLPVVYRWARNTHDERIAIVGDWLQYPLYGKDLSNYVQYIGVRGAQGSYRPVTSCREWRRQINAGDYTYVLTAPNPAFLDDIPVEARWTRTDASVVFVLQDRGASLWRLTGPLDVDGCPSS